MHVQLIEDGRVELGGVRAGTEVEDELDELLVLASSQAKKSLRSTLALRVLPAKVRLLVRPGEVIHGHDILPPLAQQFAHQGTADEARRSGHDDHGAKVGACPGTMAGVTPAPTFVPACRSYTSPAANASARRTSSAALSGARKRTTPLSESAANPNWHGHNYVLWVTVAGAPDPETSFVIDLSELRTLHQGTT
jgi:hypothetical protein